jgi:hypothetical protein
MRHRLVLEEILPEALHLRCNLATWKVDVADALTLETPQERRGAGFIPLAAGRHRVYFRLGEGGREQISCQLYGRGPPESHVG